MTKPADDPDLELMTRWRAGDARAAEQLTRRYHGVMRQFYATKVRPGEVDDLVQQVWVALAEAQGRGAEVRTSLRAYIYGIARHVLFAHLRARHRQMAVDPIESSIAALEPSLSQMVGQRVQAQRMMLALQGLPVDTQVLLELRYFTSLSTAELAALYEVPTGTIKSRLSAARKSLERAMGQRLDGPAR